MAQPVYPGAQPLPVLTAMLQRSTASSFHALWSNDVSLLDDTQFNHSWIHNHK